jgi:hypothetical protein
MFFYQKKSNCWKFPGFAVFRGYALVSIIIIDEFPFLGIPE